MSAADFARELERVAFDGAWSPEQVLHAMPLVLWRYYSKEQVSQLAREIRAVHTMLERFFTALGPVDSAEALTDAIDRHYREYPIDPHLWRALERAFRTQLEDTAAPNEAAQRLVGRPPEKTLVSAPPPANSVRASPLARFAFARGDHASTRSR